MEVQWLARKRDHLLGAAMLIAWGLGGRRGVLWRLRWALLLGRVGVLASVPWPLPGLIAALAVRAVPVPPAAARGGPPACVTERMCRPCGARNGGSPGALDAGVVGELFDQVEELDAAVLGHGPFEVARRAGDFGSATPTAPGALRTRRSGSRGRRGPAGRRSP